MKVGFFARGLVGTEVVFHTIREYSKLANIAFVMSHPEDNPIFVSSIGHLCKKREIGHFTESEMHDEMELFIKQTQLDYLFLIGWENKAIASDLVQHVKQGIVISNLELHGVSQDIIDEKEFTDVKLHLQTKDGYYLIAKKKVPVSMVDNNKTLSRKKYEYFINMFHSVYPQIISLNVITETEDDNSIGLFPIGYEIDLDKEYKAHDLLNIIRANTLADDSHVYFMKDNVKYKVLLDIKKE